MPEVKIGRFSVQNTLGVKAAEYVWDPAINALVIGGDNGAGKTSLCDSIWMALGGKPSQSKVIHGDADESVVELELVDPSGEVKLKVQRKTRLVGDQESSRLIVKPGDDSLQPFRSPQEVLDKLINKFTFDPMQFAEATPKDQAKSLKKSIGFDEIEKQWKERHDAILAELKTITSEQASLVAKNQGVAYDETLPTEAPSTESLLAELREANIKNSERGVLVSQRSELARQLEEVDQSIKSLEDQLERAKMRRVDIVSRGSDLSNSISSFPVPDIEGISNRLAQVSETKKKIDANNQIAADMESWKALEAKRVEHEKSRIESLEGKGKLFTECLKNASLPDGLVIVEDELYYGDVPFAQVNTAQKIRVAAQVALIGNPGLKLIHIARGESLTKPNLEALKALASELDCQMLIELACSQEEIDAGFRSPEIIIEDGYIQG